MSDCFILLAAGKGKRFGSKTLKQFYILNGKPLMNYSIEKAIKSKIFKEIIIVTNSKINKPKQKFIKIIKGGSERFKSSKNALEYIKNKTFKNVFIHDAARPNFSIKLLQKLKKELAHNKAVIPYTNTDDTVKYKNGLNLTNLKRENLILTQTPQCFDFKTLYKLSNNNKNVITDEATLFIENDQKIKFIKGEKNNFKITTKKDLDKIRFKTFYGIGFDIHKLEKNKKLYLGGLHIPYHSGLKGHSDGDVILHAIIDAILGAIRKKDIGTYFPDDKKKFKNIRSIKMLKPILIKLSRLNYVINNLDINLICEQPKVSKYRDKIIKSLSKLMSLERNRINLKGKTVEKLGLIGKEKAIACEVIASVINHD
ncbi:2-C-methyl-D-erythritol 2,4-cyclodiphosphate synthase [Candidatus Pelagibacter sp.]|nr:2-C-methyl-D-erythritol 2,4-cyclodiphosphate synthase [Candidatus Pelagibacter sp.]